MKAHPKDAVFLAYLGELALARKDYAAPRSTIRPCCRSNPTTPSR